VKGHKKIGESDEDTIFRELKEETGITKAKIIKGFEDSIEYYFKIHNNLVQKKVKFFLMIVDQNVIRLSKEHVDFKWLPYKKAIKKATFENAKELIKKVAFFLKNSLDSHLTFQI